MKRLGQSWTVAHPRACQHGCPLTAASQTQAPHLVWSLLSFHLHVPTPAPPLSLPFHSCLPSRKSSNEALLHLVTLGRRIATQSREISCAFANTVFSMSITTWHLPLRLTEIKIRAGTDTHIDWLWIPCLYLRIAYGRVFPGPTHSCFQQFLSSACSVPGAMLGTIKGNTGPPIERGDHL